MSSRNYALISNLCIKGKIDLHLLLGFHKIKYTQSNLNIYCYQKQKKVLVLSADDMVYRNPNGLWLQDWIQIQGHVKTKYNYAFRATFTMQR
jgi:hypothetical protein